MPVLVAFCVQQRWRKAEDQSSIEKFNRPLHEVPFNLLEQ